MKATIKKKLAPKQVNTKKGPSYTVGILCVSEKGAENWVNFWDAPVVRSWKEGDVIEFALKKNGKYFNGTPMDGARKEGLDIDTQLMIEILAIKRMVGEIKELLSAEQLPKMNQCDPGDDFEVPDDSENPDNVEF